MFFCQTASGAYPQPMWIDPLFGINRRANAADRQGGRSTMAYLEELRRALAAMQAAFTRTVASSQ